MAEAAGELAINELPAAESAGVEPAIPVSAGAQAAELSSAAPEGESIDENIMVLVTQDLHAIHHEIPNLRALLGLDENDEAAAPTHVSIWIEKHHDAVQVTCCHPSCSAVLTGWSKYRFAVPGMPLPGQQPTAGGLVDRVAVYHLDCLPNLLDFSKPDVVSRIRTLTFANFAERGKISPHPYDPTDPRLCSIGAEQVVEEWKEMTIQKPRNLDPIAWRTVAFDAVRNQLAADTGMELYDVWTTLYRRWRVKQRGNLLKNQLNRYDADMRMAVRNDPEEVERTGLLPNQLTALVALAAKEAPTLNLAMET